jgi:hypothetical protein
VYGGGIFSGRPISSQASRRAVSHTSSPLFDLPELAPKEWVPPGRATSPAWVRNFIDRVVNATCKFPFLSPNSRIRTDARCFHVAAKVLD